MSYLQKLSWYQSIEKFDEITVSLLLELSNPNYRTRRIRALKAKLNIGDYTINSIIKQLSVDGIVYIANSPRGELCVGLVEKITVRSNTLIKHRIDGKLNSSIVFEQTSSDCTHIVKDYLMKSGGLSDPKKVDSVIDTGYIEWHDNTNRVHIIEIGATKLVSSF